MNCTTFGGSTRFRGCIPILANSSWNGLHHRIRVFTDTPARRANSDFNIAFIPSINFLIVLLALVHPPLRKGLRTNPPVLSRKQEIDEVDLLLFLLRRSIQFEHRTNEYPRMIANLRLPRYTMP